MGYDRVGPSERVCQANGQFTGEDTICVQKECQRLAVPENGNKRWELKTNICKMLSEIKKNK